MAEVTSNSTTATQCSPPTKGETTSTSKMEDTDAFKSVGSLTFTIANFREFSKLSPGKDSMRHCDATVGARGLTFGLAVYPYRYELLAVMRMGSILKCQNDEKGNGSCWSCLASVTMRIKKLPNLEKENFFIYKFTHKFFSSKEDSSKEDSSKEEASLEWDYHESCSFYFLLDPKNGLYNEKEDTLELIAEITVDAPLGILELPKSDAIQMNGETVFINKIQLAMHSRYFFSLFYNRQFDEGKFGEYKVIIEAPTTVEHFKRMVQTMYPENRPLDDECIEGVLHLANQFLVTDVEGKCLEFLREKSAKSALFKYRVADKYGCTALKAHVLLNLGIEDFKDNMFLANMAECVQLGSGAAEELEIRFAELFL